MNVNIGVKEILKRLEALIYGLRNEIKFPARLGELDSEQLEILTTNYINNIELYAKGLSEDWYELVKRRREHESK